MSKAELYEHANSCISFFPSFKGASKCLRGENGESRIMYAHKTDVQTCADCPHYKYRYITYPLTIENIDVQKIDTKGLGHECGEEVFITPCDEEYEGKTFDGIYLGDLPISIRVSLDEGKGELKIGTIKNPAIYVPELKKIVYGCESWWGVKETDVNTTGQPVV